MTNFLEIALRNAARGFRVHPLRGKDAILKGWPSAATTDEAQIRGWAEQYPDYNAGVAGGPDVAIVDSDRVTRLKELSGESAVEWFRTYSVSSGRPDRAHFYYRMTPEVAAFGNKKWAEPGIPLQDRSGSSVDSLSDGLTGADARVLREIMFGR
jgi:hypothetical protein